MPTSPQTPIEDQRRIWRRRIDELNRQAAAEIRRAIRETGIGFDAALDRLLASTEGARAFAEFCWISDALAAKDASAEPPDRTWIN